MAVDFARKSDVPTASRLVQTFVATVPKDCNSFEQEARQ